MKVETKKTIKYRMLRKIQSNSSNVILRRDVANLDSPRQVSRGLKAMVENKVLIKLGYGIYSKLKRSKISEDFYLENGFLATAREALSKLGIPWEPSQAEQEYNAARTQQVPIEPATQLKARFRRRLSYRNKDLRFEQVRKKY